jgi:type III secretory pathway component EscR
MMIQRKNILLFSSDDSENEGSSPSAKKKSLEEKMKAWEATEDEVKAATLGGVVPSGGQNNAERTDAFDVGLYIYFPFMVLSGVAVALFPFIVGNLDVNSVGPPPSI